MSRSEVDSLLHRVGRIQLGDHDNISFMDDSVSNRMNETEKKFDKSRIRIKDKSDRATLELVLDPRTRRMLQSMISNGHMTAIHGAIATGKEANVYLAESKNGYLAVKIFKTSILVFKDRARYVTGEHRWRNGYCSSNPRKMVKLWAEKEMRNQKRLNLSGIPSPKPVLLKSHILVMSLIGDEAGVADPRLKDAAISDEQKRSAYLQLIRHMRTMFHVCRLVHADLSEYNILYRSSTQTLSIIDVGQAVEPDHPHAMEFLKKDIQNVNRFFASGGAVNVMSDQELFYFITVLDSDLNESQRESWLSEMMQKERSKQEEDDEEQVFHKTFVPRRLDEVVDYEREFDGVMAGRDSSIHNALRAMAIHTETKPTKDDENKIETVDENDKDEDDDDDDDESDEDENDEKSVPAKQPVKPVATQSTNQSMIARAMARAKAARLTESERRERDRGKDKRRVGEIEDAFEGRPQHSDFDESDDESGDESEEWSSSEEENDSEDEQEITAESVDPWVERVPTSREDARSERKTAKKTAKAAQAEKRKSKIKKKDKKRKIKTTQSRKK